MVDDACFMDFSSEIDENTEFIIIGIPIDGEMTQNRGICTDAPNIIRKISLDLSLTSEDGTDLNSLHIVDLGNMSSKRGNHLSQVIRKAPDAIPILVGGSHFISKIGIDAIKEDLSLEDLHFISLDAHLDCYDEWKGKKFTHCTVTRRIFEKLGSKPELVYVIGARDIDLPEIEWAKKVGLNYLRMNEIQDNADLKINALFSEKNGEKPPVYLSVDIDVFDPTVAPATGYAIPGGITYRDYLHILEQITENFELVAVDFVEYSPELDLPNKMTAFLVAKLIIETANMLKKKKGK